MTIQVLKKNSLHNLEHSQYAINLHTICTEANIEKINALLPALQKAIDKEEQALNLPRGKEFIKEIRQLDAARDESYQALRLCVELAKHKRAADVKAAAKEVEKVMKRYPDLVKQSNNKETSAIRNLADDLNDAKMAPLVLKIGAKADLDQLVADNDAFAAMFLKHYSATPPSTEFDIKKLRAETDEAINAVVTRMQSLADLLPDTVGLSALITRYNKMVADSHLTLALRKAAADKKDKGNDNGKEKPGEGSDDGKGGKGKGKGKGKGNKPGGKEPGGKEPGGNGSDGNGSGDDQGSGGNQGGKGKEEDNNMSPEKKLITPLLPALESELNLAHDCLAYGGVTDVQDGVTIYLIVNKRTQEEMYVKVEGGKLVVVQKKG